MIKFILLLLLSYDNIQSYECPFSGLFINNTETNETIKETAVQENFLIPHSIPKKLSSIEKYDINTKQKIKSGNLKPLDPHILKIIQKELVLSDNDMQQLVFFVDTKNNTLNAYASTEGYNCITINQQYYELVNNALQNLPCYCTILSQKFLIPSSLAIKIFLAIISHEIGHIKRRNHYELISYKNERHRKTKKIYEEIKADANTLNQHCGAAYITWGLHNFSFCYVWLSHMDENFLEVLIPDPTIRKSNYLKQVQYVMEHTSDVLEKKVYSLKNLSRTHPTYKERMNYFKKRCKKNPSHKGSPKGSPECITLDLRTYSYFFFFSRKKEREITICEPYEEFQDAMKQFSQ